MFRKKPRLFHSGYLEEQGRLCRTFDFLRLYTTILFEFHITLHSFVREK